MKVFRLILGLMLFLSILFLAFSFGWSSREKAEIQKAENKEEYYLLKTPRSFRRVFWNQISETYDIWWDESKESLKFQSQMTGKIKEFSSEELFKITGKKDFYVVINALGINNYEKDLIIAVGLVYTRMLPEGGSTSGYQWVKYTVETEELTSLPINSEKVLLVHETLFFLDAENSDSPGSISGYDLANDLIVVEFPMIRPDHQLIPVGLSSDKENLIINCFTSSSGDFGQSYYFGAEKSCGDYLGNLKTGKLSKIQ